METPLKHFAEMKDPRLPRTRRHLLTDIVSVSYTHLAPLRAIPASKSARLAPQTVAIEEEPLDSRMSETMRMV